MNLKRKLTSRKLWLAVIGFITALLVAFKADAATVESVTGIISAFGVLIAYILGESYVDGKHSDDKEETTHAIGFDIGDDDIE